MLATNGDTHLGGEDFDQRVMQYFIKVFNRKTGINIADDKKATQKLRREVRSSVAGRVEFLVGRNITWVSGRVLTGLG